jgi:hypothetical protein
LAARATRLDRSGRDTEPLLDSFSFALRAALKDSGVCVMGVTDT